jgi:tRNA A-37 threonylcarbamoyl transferase component Bud32
VRRLGDPNSRTLLYTLKHRGGELMLAVKKFARAKSVKWAALSVWTAPVKKFRIDPLFRLGTEYRALRYLRTLGLQTPVIEAVVLDRRLLATRFIEGASIADVIRQALAGGDASPVKLAGEQIARVHAYGSAFGNIKPKNVVVNDDLYFTDLEQFVFEGGDPAWDVAQFLCWGLKGVRRPEGAAMITGEFLQGYGSRGVIEKLARSRRYIETFYPVLVPSVAQAIRKELKSY